MFLSGLNISRPIMRSWTFDWHSILKLISSKLLGPRAGQLAPWFPCSAPMWKPCPCPVWRTPCWQMTGLYPVAWFGTTGAATRCATSRRSPGTGPPHRILPKAAPSAAREKSPWSCPCPRSPCAHPRRASRWVMMWDWRMMSTARTFFTWNPPRCLMMRLGSELGSAMVGVVWEELFSEVRTNSKEELHAKQENRCHTEREYQVRLTYTRNGSIRIVCSPCVGVHFRARTCRASLRTAIFLCLCRFYVNVSENWVPVLHNYMNVSILWCFFCNTSISDRNERISMADPCTRCLTVTISAWRKKSKCFEKVMSFSSPNRGLQIS